MVAEIKKVGNSTKRRVEIVWEVIALSATVAVTVRAAVLPKVNGVSLWQIAAAVVLTGVLVKIGKLIAKEV